MSKLFAAIDIGASSGRIMAGRIGADSIALSEIHRFANEPLRRGSSLYWDFESLKVEIAKGLQLLAEFADLRGLEVSSVAVDTWAVDYGLLDADGQLIDGIRHYRDERNALGVGLVEQVLSPEELYAINGLQFLQFNTLYQLAAEQMQNPEHFSRAKAFLMVPDLINHWLTGVARSERTNASSTGLMDLDSHEWNRELIERIGLKSEIFGELISPGEEIGPLLSQFRTSVSLAQTVVVAAPSHDTASAVAGTPLENDTTAFLSSGTWSLLGLELASPNNSSAARQENFTNELGVENRTRFLKNLSGLWLVQQSLVAFERTHPNLGLPQLLAQASSIISNSRIRVTDDAFAHHGDMPAKIQTACARAGFEVPSSPAAIIRCILDSLADAYADALVAIERVSGTKVTEIHIVGGGSQNDLLSQLTADVTGLTVVTGPVEATALGNLMTQASAQGIVAPGLKAQRKLIRQTFAPKKFQPARSVRG